MATSVKKTKSVWFCSHCGNEYSKWMGRCPACGEWNTMVEKEVVAGGLRITDPACDLAVICAVLSSTFDYPIPADVCFAGEVGLSALFK